MMNELPALLDGLLQHTQAWSAGQRLPPDADETLRRAVLSVHHHHRARVAVYRQLVEQDNAVDVDVDHIVNRLMFSDEVFKSYQPEWLQAAEFERMTAWLADRFVRRPTIDVDAVGDVADWRNRLRADGVFVSTSTGTSGRLSFVPRDRLTLQALARNGAAYHHQIWADGAGYPAFDSLILAPLGTATGLQSAGVGLARMGRRAHHLFDTDLTSAAFGSSSSRAASAGDRIIEGVQAPVEIERLEAAYARAIEFLRESSRDRVRIIIFGAPFQMTAFCERIRAQAGRVEATPRSLVITGGGWKSFEGRRLSRTELAGWIGETLGIPGDHVIDTYSTAELNCVFMTCASAHYHIPPLVAPVVLDAAMNGSWQEEGSGTLGILDPFALSYPAFLITGDHVNLFRDRCACGLEGWFISGEIHRAAGQSAKGCGGTMASIMA